MTRSMFETQELMAFEKRAKDLCQNEGYMFRWARREIKGINHVFPTAVADAEREYDIFVNKNGIFIGEIPHNVSWSAEASPVGLILERKPGIEFKIECYVFEEKHLFKAMLLVEKHLNCKARLFFNPNDCLGQTRIEKMSRLFRTAKAYYTTDSGEVKYPLWINDVYIGEEKLF